MMPAISMARLEMIKVDTPATVSSVRLLRSLMATGVDGDCRFNMFMHCLPAFHDSNTVVTPG